MIDIDKIYWSFMCAASFVILALVISLVGCVGPLRNQPATTCHPLSVTITERVQDPCELEYWEEQQLAEHNPNFQSAGD